MEEIEEYYLVRTIGDTHDILEITTNIQLWMQENNCYYCEIERFDTIDSALDEMIAARDRLNEFIKNKMI